MQTPDCGHRALRLADPIFLEAPRLPLSFPAGRSVPTLAQVVVPVLVNLFLP